MRKPNPHRRPVAYVTGGRGFLKIKTHFDMKNTPNTADYRPSREEMHILRVVHITRQEPHNHSPVFERLKEQRLIQKSRCGGHYLLSSAATDAILQEINQRSN